MVALTDGQIRDRLYPGEIPDDLLLAVLGALRTAGHDLAVTDAYGIGPAQAAAELHIDGGRRIRITVEPW